MQRGVCGLYRWASQSSPLTGHCCVNILITEPSTPNSSEDPAGMLEMKRNESIRQDHRLAEDPTSGVGNEDRGVPPDCGSLCFEERMIKFDQSVVYKGIHR
jgi:hypothetical protein